MGILIVNGEILFVDFVPNMILDPELNSWDVNHYVINTRFGNDVFMGDRIVGYEDAGSPDFQREIIYRYIREVLFRAWLDECVDYVDANYRDLDSSREFGDLLEDTKPVVVFRPREIPGSNFEEKVAELPGFVAEKLKGGDSEVVEAMWRAVDRIQQIDNPRSSRTAQMLKDVLFYKEFDLGEGGSAYWCKLVAENLLYFRVSETLTEHSADLNVLRMLGFDYDKRKGLIFDPRVLAVALMGSDAEIEYLLGRTLGRVNIALRDKISDLVFNMRTGGIAPKYWPESTQAAFLDYLHKAQEKLGSMIPEQDRIAAALVQT
jgi:hypothetical protein